MSEPHGRFVVVPASYVFLLREGASGPEVLLQLRQNTGYMDDHWAAAAAGHVEQGETAYDAAHREALEEVGVTDLDLTFVTAMQRTRGGEPIDERIDFFFTARSWSGEPRIVEPEKAADLRWCPLDDLPDPVVPHERSVLDALRTGTTTAYSTFGFWRENRMPSDDELGPRPEPHIDPGEPNPGGVDAVDDFSGPIAIPDLSPDENPAIDEKAPETVKQEVRKGEDTSTKATRDEHDSEDPDREAPGMSPHGEMGVSSERVGPAGPGQEAPEGVRDVAPHERDPAEELPPEHSPGNREDNPDGLPPKAGYSDTDPRSDDEV